LSKIQCKQVVNTELSRNITVIVTICDLTNR